MDFERYIHLKDNETIEPSFKAMSIPGTLTGGECEESSHVEMSCRVHILSQAAYILPLYAQGSCMHEWEKLNKLTIKYICIVPCVCWVSIMTQLYNKFGERHTDRQKKTIWPKAVSLWAKSVCELPWKVIMRCFFDIMTASDVAFQRSGYIPRKPLGQWWGTGAALGMYKSPLHFIWYEYR